MQDFNKACEITILKMSPIGLNIDTSRVYPNCRLMANFGGVFMVFVVEILRYVTPIHMIHM